MNTKINIATAPKTSTFQMRINPDIKQQVEEVYASQGLTFTDAVNIFIQQSINSNGLPFLASPENEEFLKAKAVHRFMDEFRTGWEAGEKDGWVNLSDAEARLGASDV